jgi:uncharacterized protein YcfJ
MNNKLVSGLIALGLILGTPVLANDGTGRGYGDAGSYDYADVIDVDPIYREVHVSVPQRECRSETYEQREPAVYATGERPAAGPMILGGLIGAVVGHQFGHGGGRDVGTAAGALVGAAIGHDAARQRSERGEDEDAYRQPRMSEREVCRMRYAERTERELDGYRVTYRYNGRTYSTQLPYEPGERIRVRVTVDPVGA